MNDTNTDLDIAAIAASPRNRCFACGPGNPHGLHLRFDREDGTVRTQFTPTELHQGWQGVVHGGILTTLLDEAMAYTLFYKGVRAVTGRMEIRFRALAMAGDTLQVEAHVVRDTRRAADIEARILRGSDIVAEGSGRFIKLGPIDPAMIIGDAPIA